MVHFGITVFNLVSFFENHVLTHKHRMVLHKVNIDRFLKWFVPFRFNLAYHLFFGLKLPLQQFSPLIVYQNLGLVLFVGPFEFTNLNPLQPTSTNFNPHGKKIPTSIHFNPLQLTSTYLNLLQPTSTHSFIILIIYKVSYEI